MKAIYELLLDLTHRILGKNKEVTAIDYVDPEFWMLGVKILSEQGKNGFYFEIKVINETNTKDEKAQYIKEVFDRFERILGNLRITVKRVTSTCRMF